MAKRKPKRNRNAQRAKPPQVQDILRERGATYGNYLEESTLAYGLQELIEKLDGEERAGIADALPDQRLALRMIAVKIARLANGDINHIDGWDDIAGYALLVANRLKEEA